MAFLDNNSSNNNNEYFGGKLSIIDNMLMTGYAAIPLSNISKIYVNDLSQKLKLPNLFWICAVAGVITLFTPLFVVGIVCIAIAVLLFLYIRKKNNQHEYGLCIESNSGSIEMYKSDNKDILFKAQHQIEHGIIALNKGEPCTTLTVYMNNGNISYESKDVIVHGDASNINTGNNNNFGVCPYD